MAFSSPIFLFYLLPLTLILGVLTRQLKAGLRDALTVALGVIFYFWGSPLFFPFLLLLMWGNYFIGSCIGLAADNSTYARRLLCFGVCANLAILGYLKYSRFFFAQLGYVTGSKIPISDPGAFYTLLFPLGISFITFQAVAYLVDIYQGRTAPASSFLAYIRYALFSPNITSGPITRYAEFQKKSAELTPYEFFQEGLFRFSIGLAKKVLIADVAGHTGNAVFKLSEKQLGCSDAWLGLVSYSAQIYFDFSGYCDMAIGLALILGIRLPENFDSPYLASSFTDFWRRWHMTFGRWMRDYVYIPLGGNRVSVPRQYLNLWIVFLLSGLWHGAQWTFVAWGAFHGFFMTLERLSPEKIQDSYRRIPLAARVLITLVLVMLSRVLFRAESLVHAQFYYRQLFFPLTPTNQPAFGLLTSPFEISMTALAYVLCLYPLLLPSRLKTRQNGSLVHSNMRIHGDMRNHSDMRKLTRAFAACALTALSLSALAGRDFSPFIYARF